MTRTNINSAQIKDDSIQIADLSDFAVIKRVSGLVADINAGTIRNDNTVTVKSTQTITITNSTTNYVELDSTGTVQTNITSFSSGNIPLATVVASGGNIITVTDKRTWLGTHKNLMHLI